MESSVACFALDRSLLVLRSLAHKIASKQAHRQQDTDLLALSPVAFAIEHETKILISDNKKLLIHAINTDRTVVELTTICTQQRTEYQTLADQLALLKESLVWTYNQGLILEHMQRLFYLIKFIECMQAESERKRAELQKLCAALVSQASQAQQPVDTLAGATESEQPPRLAARPGSSHCSVTTQTNVSFDGLAAKNCANTTTAAAEHPQLPGARDAACSPISVSVVLATSSVAVQTDANDPSTAHDMKASLQLRKELTIAKADARICLERSQKTEHLCASLQRTLSAQRELISNLISQPVLIQSTQESKDAESRPSHHRHHDGRRKIDAQKPESERELVSEPQGEPSPAVTSRYPRPPLYAGKANSITAGSLPGAGDGSSFDDVIEALELRTHHRNDTEAHGEPARHSGNSLMDAVTSYSVDHDISFGVSAEFDTLAEDEKADTQDFDEGDRGFGTSYTALHSHGDQLEPEMRLGLDSNTTGEAEENYSDMDTDSSHRW
jgi:hypothetical protein